MGKPISTESMEEVERGMSSVAQSTQSCQALVPGYLDKGPDQMEVVGERKRSSASGRCQGYREVAVQGIVAVLGLLVHASGKSQTVATSLKGHHPALDSPGASSLLGEVAKGNAPEGHCHRGAGEVGKLIRSHGMGGMEFQPQ